MERKYDEKGVHVLSSLKQKVKQTVKSFKYTFQDPKKFPDKLHLGCGFIRAEGWCNVDIYATQAVDILDDITELKHFPNNYASMIYTCHVLEHFSHEDCKKVLKRWLEVLKPGGEIRISVPDMDRIVKIYHKNWQHFQTPGNSPWVGLIYGGQWNQYDYHKTGFNFCWLKHIMEEIGYERIEEYEHSPHFIPNLSDASLAHEPFGEFLSLNIKAFKKQNH